MRDAGYRNLKASTRPMRVAFLVNPSNLSSKQIHEIVSWCCGHWGGTFSPIIPTDGSGISDDWWQLLVLADPDIIHSNVEISDALVEKINRFITPFEILEHIVDDASRDRYLDYSSLKGLGIQDVPNAMWDRRDPFREFKFLYIKDSFEESVDAYFVARNFGCLDGVVSTAAGFAQVPSETCEVRGRSAKEMFNKVIENAFVYPRELSRFMCSKPFSLHYERFHEGHHIVVGDGPHDFLYHWNRNLVASEGTNFHTIWIPESFFKETEWVDLVVKFLHRRSWSNQDHTHKLISYTLDQDSLIPLAKSLSEKYHAHFEPTHLEQGRFTVPTSYGAKTNQHFTMEYQLHQPREFSLVHPPKPTFGKKATFSGTWGVDFELEIKSDPAINYGSMPTWKIPRRLGVSYAFLKDVMYSRINGAGNVSAFLTDNTFPTNNKNGIYFREPSAREIVWPFLNQQPFVNRRQDREKWSKGTFDHLETSDKGFYLKGVIKLFGGLWWAANTFEDGFWREVFMELAAKPTEKLEEIRGKLSQIFPVPPDESSENVVIPMDQFSGMLDKASEIIFHRRKALGYKPINHDALCKKFEVMRGEANKKGDNTDFRDGEKFAEYRGRDLQEHIESRVLLQGVTQRCHSCRSLSWYHVNDLESVLKCPNCFESFPLDPSPEWSYKLNGLIEQALDRHGTLSVIHALQTLQNGSKGSFAYLPSQDIFKNYNHEKPMPFTDLDVVAIVEGKFAVAEVKSNPRTLKQNEFDKMIEVARELCPDYLIFFATFSDKMDQWPDWLDEKIKAANAEFQTQDTKVLKWPLIWRSGRILDLGGVWK